MILVMRRWGSFMIARGRRPGFSGAGLAARGRAAFQGRPTAGARRRGLPLALLGPWVWVLLLVGTVLGQDLRAASPCGKDGAGGKKSLLRTVDPVLVQGNDLGRVQGLPVEGFRLFSSSGGRMAPVPFQIDEVDAEGLFVLPEGKDPNRDKGRRGKEEEQDQRLDGNDELVFMASDLGDRACTEQGLAGAAQAVEIEVRDPRTGGTGWSYLMWFEDPPPPSPRDYVRYAREEDRIHTEVFSLGYSPARDLVYTTYLSMTPRTGSPPVDIMDRINIRFWATIFLRSITFSRNEDDFVSEVIAYKDGPVRVMRRVANSMRLVMGIQSPKIIAYSVYYRDAIETPNVLSLPVSLGSVARSAGFEGGTDHNRNALGMRFFSSNNPQGVLVDGRMSPEELAMDFGDYKFTLLSGEPGQVLSLVRMGETIRDVLYKKLIYVDDMFGSNAPEDEPGTTPKIGFSLENLLALKRGTYTYNACFYFLSEYGPGREKAYLDVLDEPLRVRAYPWPGER
jgi:hypothetical protein